MTVHLRKDDEGNLIFEVVPDEHKKPGFNWNAVYEKAEKPCWPKEQDESNTFR